MESRVVLAFLGEDFLDHLAVGGIEFHDFLA
jgi:hypothetical protein